MKDAPLTPEIGELQPYVKDYLVVMFMSEGKTEGGSDGWTVLDC